MQLGGFRQIQVLQDRFKINTIRTLTIGNFSLNLV